MADADDRVKVRGSPVLLLLHRRDAEGAETGTEDTGRTGPRWRKQVVRNLTDNLSYWDVFPPLLDRIQLGVPETMPRF
jgi:hypothetical protein